MHTTPPVPQMQRGFMPDKLKQFEHDLDEIIALLLKAKEPMTARQIAKKLKCSKQAVYFRIAALKKRRDVVLRTSKAREGEHGPFSRAWSLG